MRRSSKVKTFPLCCKNCKCKYFTITAMIEQGVQNEMSIWCSQCNTLAIRNYHSIDEEIQEPGFNEQLHISANE